ncbi:MAG: hypothetical protein ACR2NI_11640 [Pirellulales bacterium]
MGTSRVATAVTMDVTDVKFAVKQATDGLKNLVGVAKQSDKSLSTLAFFKKWEVGLKVFNKIVGIATNSTKTFFNVLKNPISGIPIIGRLVEPFEQFVKQTTKATLDQFNLGRAIGASFDEMQALALAAQDVGLEVNQLYEPISKLPRKIQEAAAGFGDSVAVFSQLPGVNIDALRDLGAKEGGIAQLKVVADSLNQVADNNQKLYLLTKIFEETGPKFQQLFELGSKGIDGFIKKVKELGISLDAEGLAKLKILNLEMAQLGASWSALSRDILIEISPSLIAFLRIIKETVADPNFRKTFTENIVGLFETVGSAFLEFTTYFIGFTDKVADLIEDIRQFGKVFFKNEQTGKSDWAAADAVTALNRIKFLKESVGLTLNENEQKRLDMFTAQLAGGLDTQELSKNAAAWNDGVGFIVKRLKALQEEIDARAAKIRKDNKEAGWQKPAEAVDKFIEKISFRAVSNAASGAAPGKLSGADINTSAGLEMFLKSFEPGYGEAKEVVLLKKSVKVQEKILAAVGNEKVVNVAGAT